MLVNDTNSFMLVVGRPIVLEYICQRTVAILIHLPLAALSRLTDEEDATIARLRPTIDRTRALLIPIDVHVPPLIRANKPLNSKPLST
jgi:hypothetical protein